MATDDFKTLAEEATLKSGIIRRELRRQILGGQFVPGDALPSEQALCARFGVARNTVRKALAELDKEGIVCRLQGKGTFVAPARPDPQGKVKLNIFCLVVPEVNRDLFPQIINGFDEAALEIHHQMMVCTTQNDVGRQGNIILQSLDKNMAGVALVTMIGKVTPPHHIRQLQTSGIPVVLLNRPVADISAPLVTWDWEQVGRIAARELLNRGYRRIGYYSNIWQPMAEGHVQGMQDVLAEHGIVMRQEHIVYLSKTNSEVIWDDVYRREFLLNMLTAPKRPEAILCNDDVEADNLLCTAQELGLKVPGDLAILGFGNQRREGLSRIRLASVTLNGFEIGRRAVELLDEMRTGVRAIHNHEVFRIELGFAPGTTI